METGRRVEVAAAPDTPPPVGTGPVDPPPGPGHVDGGHTAQTSAGYGHRDVARHDLLVLVIVRHTVRHRHGV